MNRILPLLLLAALASHAAAEVISYRMGDTIELPCVVSAQPVPGSLRALVLMNETKMSVKGTWDVNDIDVVLNGNVVRVNLKAAKPIPIGILGSSGTYYVVVAKPAAAATGAALSPTVQVILDQNGGGAAGDRPQDRSDPQGRAGGSWEHTTNLMIRLQKHIRGGRTLTTVAGMEQYNEEVLRTEHRRIPGKVWTLSDDWRVLEYYSWTLGQVTAHYIGVTYTGRQAQVDFNYLQQQTDRTIAIWHQPKAGEPQVYSVRYPVVTLQQGQESFFLLYTNDQP